MRSPAPLRVCGSEMTDHIRNLDRAVSDWSSRNAVHVLRVGLGVVFIWFGGLKFSPGLSPAEGLIAKTVGWAVDPGMFLIVLAIWECAMGVALLLGRFPRLTLLLFAAHMSGTFMPLGACPEEVWTRFPLVLTLEGQYIFKNLVLVGAGLVVADHLRRRADVASAARRARRRQRSARLVWVDYPVASRNSSDRLPPLDTTRGLCHPKTERGGGARVTSSPRSA